jgi:hypothetical protein
MTGKSITKAYRFTAMAAALMAAILTGRAEAGVVIDITQDGNNVVATGSGTLDTTDLTVHTTTETLPAILYPSLAVVLVGPTTPSHYEYFTGITGPESFGPTSAPEYASSGSGDFFGVQGGDGGAIAVPVGYASGSSLSATATWDNATIASLGLTTGTYAWTWGAGTPDADSLTVNITSVPEPSTMVMAATALGAFAVVAYRRRRAAAKSLPAA